MLNFYPGPSAVYPAIETFLQDAFAEGILSIQHRSSAFVDISQRVQNGLQQKLGMPKDYVAFYLSSATEAWDVINRNFPAHEFFHFFNGSFGKKWHNYRRSIFPTRTQALPFDYQALPPDFVRPVPTQTLFALTHNETSNGTQIPAHILPNLRKRYPNALIAVDATSSMAGVTLDWLSADLWLASVQKCFGLPAGLGLLIASPGALEQARNPLQYNDLGFLAAQMQHYQTNHTPNVLGIYLLARVLEMRQAIPEISTKIQTQAKDWYHFLAQQGYACLVKEPKLRSNTVIAVSGPPSWVAQIKARAYSSGFVLGNGYGDWKANTFRIANFPAITPESIAQLQFFFKKQQLP
ncbi:MAG: aminotransferase class V-fold PLP-dependent enzyme [Bernardetiaceae bacterium]